MHKTRNIKDCEDYSGIHLLNSCYKIYIDTLKNKFYTCYRNKADEKWSDFWKGWSCSDGYFTLKFLLKNTENLILKPTQHLEIKKKKKKKKILGGEKKKK